MFADRRRSLLASFTLALLAATGARAAAPPDHSSIAPLLAESERERRRAQRELVAVGATGLVPGLVDAIFFTPKRHRAELFATLRALTGHDAGDDYYSWVEWLGEQTSFPPAPGYLAWKRTLFAKIDPAYLRLFDPNAPVRLRPEEIVFGGARLDGIPALDDPPTVPASEATHLVDDELVFGVSFGGRQRAYPHRYLSWHEMANDVVGGVPIVLSY
jgi:hypothetical protein